MTNLEINAQLTVEMNALREMIQVEGANLNEHHQNNSEELDLAAEDMTELSSEDSILSEITVYQKLTEFESIIKTKKEIIKKQLMEYMKEKGLERTPSQDNLFATIETRGSYSLDPMLLQIFLQDDVYSRIVVKSVDVDKVKDEFLKGNIPVSLLRTAEVYKEKEAFAIRKETRDYKENKKLPFWADSTETNE